MNVRVAQAGRRIGLEVETLAERAARWSKGFYLLVACLLGVVAAGCTPHIGDNCSISTDCSINGDRLCDTTQPGGYCTVFGCEPDTCPSDESICVAFSDDSCPNTARSARLERTFCMATCDSDSDCRSGYACRDVTAASIIDTDKSKTTVCVALGPSDAITSDASSPAPVCEPSDATFPSPDGASDAGADASADAPLVSEEATSPDAPEAEPPDAEPLEAEPPDAPEAEPPDAEPLEAEPPDAEPLETGSPDGSD